MNDDRSHRPEPGQELSHYRLIEKLGKGGMGEVFLAEDLTLGRRVALKILPEDADSSPEKLERFHREARTVAALNHANIVTIFSVEEDCGVRFLTMELIQGASLRKVISEGGMSANEFVDLAVDLTGALVAAHHRGVVHRDLKPENVMITRDGSAKVLDFGIAKLVRSGSDDTLEIPTQSLTREGCVVGTIPYMSPEQLRGLAAGPQSDIFSLGIIFFEMLTGRRPFRGKTQSDMISAILRDPPDSLQDFRTDVSPMFEPMIRRCLEKDPNDRFQSAEALHQALLDFRRQLEVEEVLSHGRQLSQPGTGLPRISRVLDQPGLFFVNTRIGLCLVLVSAFVANYIETSAETWTVETFGVATGFGYQVARVAHWMEAGFVFHNHDHANLLAVYGYSLSYYFLFPIMIAYCLLATARSVDIAPFRMAVLSPVFAYLIHLPFFVFFPLPERWAYPDSGAILLSDLWSTQLIETIRPISGLDNCFPSFHVSFTVIVILVCYAHRVRFRFSLLCIGLTVIFATLVLGIHWFVDVLGGIVVGVVAVWLAWRLEHKIGFRQMAGSSSARCSLPDSTPLGLKVSDQRDTI